MSIAKAFLSHSSKDKEFVTAVANELGRQHCIVDKQVFETGTEFKQSIQDGLDSSSVFVLFASKNSLLSDWVNFEVEEAWYKKLERNLQKSLVSIITDSIDIEQLPIWLKRAKIQRGNVAKSVAREIRTHLDQLREERKNPFVGRTGDIQTLQEALTPADVEFPPHVFFVTGLPGIGRRSLIQQVVEDSLGLKPLKSPFRLGEGFSIQDICSSVANLNEPYTTDLRFQQIMREIQALSKEEALDRTLVNLRRMTNNGELPIFLDEGGLFDSDGNLSEPIQSIIQKLSLNDEAYIAFVSNRRPLNGNQSIVRIRLNPLKTEDQKLLIRTLDRKYLRVSSTRQKSLKSNEISELAAYTAGYPPSAYAAMEQVEEYGIDIVLADKNRFVELRIDQFLKHFSKEKLSESEKDILRLLASYSPLPLRVITLTVLQDIIITSNNLARLIDLSFVVVEDGLYRVSDPIEDAAIKAFGLTGFEVIKILVKSIIDLIDDPNYEEQRLDLHRILYRASWYLKDKKIQRKVIFLFTDLIKTIKSLYDHERNYPKVIEATEVALNNCKNKSDYETVISYRAKAFIHQEKWQEAEQEIQKFKEYAPLRNFYYLEGFLNRKQRKNQDAIDFYLESRRYGRDDEALNRELGHCYFFVGNYEKANECVQKVLQRQQDKKRVNFYALDLQAQIAIALGDVNLAKRSIEQLQYIDESAHYYRKSRFEFLLGDKYVAEQDAEKAKSSDNNPRFQTLAHLALCKIVNGKVDEAESILNEIERNQQFGAINSDIRKGLRTRLAIARSRYEDAFYLITEIRDKSSKSYKGIRRDVLQGYLNTCVIPDSERTKLDAELTILKAELTSINEAELATEIDSYFDID
ncbi:MAG: TIR domain-containing protein [Nostoc sp. NMS7]|uniref:TIR domain-containing protein n=1 Tax=Nostoc sp. NMS7 TaxID=2815391 RepID=UPI0025CEE003|nr:TIR domain-containing protein [Nostoc sp. NMS7]MBN3950106.1 TIR domain-containing protein [Nostoc sp. NMS7]